MTRPVDWYVLDLDADPVPGEPGSVRQLARAARRTGEDAETARTEVRSLAGDQTVLTWVGAAGDVFRDAIGDFPAQLGKVADSYGLAADALQEWAGTLDGAQSDADNALARGRDARARLESLTGQLGGAESSLRSASATVDRLSVAPPGSALPPDPDQVRSAIRNAQYAAQRVNALADQVDAARQELDLAKRLALQAKSVREQAATTTTGRLRQAAEAGIRPDSFWHDLKDAAGKAWKAIVVVAKVVAAVITVIAIVAIVAAVAFGATIIGAAAAAVLAVAGFIAGLVIFVDVFTKYRDGRATRWDVFWAIVGIIPVAKGLKYVGKLVAVGAKLATKTASTVAHKIRSTAEAVRSRIGAVTRRIQHPSVEAPPRPSGASEAKTPLTAADRSAIDVYTNNNPLMAVGSEPAFKEFNEALRAGKGLVPHHLAPHVEALATALGKLPPYQGVVYRGTSLVDDVLSRYKDGKVVTEWGFESASSDPNSAKTFAQNVYFDPNSAKTFAQNVYFIINSKTGRDVAPYSIFDESEVLFDRGTRFYVDSRVWDSNLSMWIITKTEVP